MNYMAHVMRLEEPCDICGRRIRWWHRKGYIRKPHILLGTVFRIPHTTHRKCVR